MESASLITKLILKALAYDDFPEKIYHYTSSEGLLGIVKSKELHLTDFMYLNDPQEIQHGLEIVRKLILDTAHEKKENTPEQQTLRKFLWTLDSNILKTGDRLSHDSIFISCFCENGDLLSQWKGYSNFGAGFSIGFNTENIVNKTNDDMFLIFSKVIYDEQAKKKVINELLNAFITTPILVKPNGDFHEETVLLIISILYTFCVFFKDESFSEENEWRLVYFPFSRLVDTKSVDFKSSHDGIIPFYKFKLDTKLSEINSVIIGPKYSYRHNLKSLNLLLKEYDINIVNSKILLK